MKFIWSTLHVKNMDASLSFYREALGLEVERSFTTGEGSQIVFLNSGTTKIELICDGSASEIDTGKDISWGFEVESLDATITMLAEKNIRIVAGPIQPNPRVRFLYIKDPDGMKIQLVENT